MIIHRAIPNELDLGDTGDCLEIGMEDGFRLVASLVVSVTVDVGLGVKSLFVGQRGSSPVEFK